MPDNANATIVYSFILSCSNWCVEAADDGRDGGAERRKSICGSGYLGCECLSSRSL